MHSGWSERQVLKEERDPTEKESLTVWSRDITFMSHREETEKREHFGASRTEMLSLMQEIRE